MRPVFPFLSFIFIFSSGLSQYDTIIKYDLISSETEILIPNLEIDSLNTSYNTNSRIGSSTKLAFLKEEIPDAPYQNSLFSELDLASNLYNIIDYPISTSIKLAYYKGDTLKPSCSGILVAQNLVLTCAHCVFNSSAENPQREWKTGRLAFPAYDNGVINPTFNYSEAIDYFIFNSWYKKTGWDDIAIIRLKDPIGEETGWIGIGYNNDITFLKNELFHVLSYPADTAWYNSTKIYNGDTLYYKYGQIKEFMNFNFLTLGLPGVPGESGSSLFYTNNNELIYSLGVLAWGAHSRFYRINNKNIHGLKYIINKYGSAEINNIYKTNPDNQIILYPNPFNDYFKINSSSISKIKSIDIYNQNGLLIKKIGDIYNKTFIINTEDFMPGIYSIKIQFENFEYYYYKMIKI